MQTKLLCSLLLLTGMSVVAGENVSESPSMERIWVIKNTNPLLFHAYLDNLSGRTFNEPVKTIMSRSGNMVIPRYPKSDNY